MARRNCTQGSLAEKLGVTQQSLSRRLLGHVPFRVDELRAIADHLDVSLLTLIDERASA